MWASEENKFGRESSFTVVQEMVEKKFVLYSVEGQVLKVTYSDSSGVLLEEMPFNQCSFTCGKITVLILVIKFVKYEIVQQLVFKRKNWAALITSYQTM